MILNNQRKISVQEVNSILDSLLSILSENERVVVMRRHGLGGKKPETLAAIGQDLGVTRERVRQIQGNAMKKMIRNVKNTDLVMLHEWLYDLLKESGDVLTESFVEKSLKNHFDGADTCLAEMKLACIINDDVVWEQNKVDFVPHFRFSDIDFKLIKHVCTKSINYLGKDRALLSQSELLTPIQMMLKDNGMNVTKKFIIAASKVDRRICVDSRGISMAEWRHVNPRTLFDKIVFVLSKIEEPVHYGQIATLIDKENFDEKNVSVQAVHNELINNPLFVLVGRGIYAMRTWGYEEGTVSDVIERVLNEKGPLRLFDLTNEVLQRRKVKPVTVQINLNSKKDKFKKNQLGQYELV